jgi:uncharacterized damage-inducible protein DinB
VRHSPTQTPKNFLFWDWPADNKADEIALPNNISRLLPLPILRIIKKITSTDMEGENGMKKEEIITLYQYNYWANGQILKVSALAGDAFYTAPAKVSFGSLQGTLVHILSTEWMWRLRCQEGKSPSFHLSTDDFPTLQILGQRWLEEERTMLAYLSNLKDTDLDRPIRYTNTRGISYTNPLWQLLLHLSNHGTQFRSEAAVILSAQEFSPGDLDFIFFLRQQPNPAL